MDENGLGFEGFGPTRPDPNDKGSEIFKWI